MSNKSEQREGRFNVYNFVCEGCGSEGELKVPVDMSSVLCPEGCGARYIQWTNPQSASPELMCVVCPVFE
jgi:hypothetical protein